MNPLDRGTAGDVRAALPSSGAVNFREWEERLNDGMPAVPDNAEMRKQSQVQRTLGPSEAVKRIAAIPGTQRSS